VQTQEGYYSKRFQAVIIWRSSRRLLIVRLGCATLCKDLGDRPEFIVG